MKSRSIEVCTIKKDEWELSMSEVTKSFYVVAFTFLLAKKSKV